MKPNALLMRSRRFSVCVLIALAGLAPNLALAADDPPLKGPKIKDQSVPGETRRFGTDQQGEKKDRTPAIQHGLFMRAVNSLRGDQAESKVRLSDEQAQKIEAIDREYRDQAREYLTKNREELRKLLADLPEKERQRVREGIARGLENAGAPPKADAKGKGKRPASRDAAPKDASLPDPEKAAAAKTRLKEIRDAAPQATDVHAKIFGVLRAEQKAAVETALKQAKSEQAANRQGPDDSKDKPNAGPSKDRLREKLKDLPPEERREAIKKLRQHRENRPKPDSKK